MEEEGYRGRRRERWMGAEELGAERGRAEEKGEERGEQVVNCDYCEVG